MHWLQTSVKLRFSKRFLYNASLFQIMEEGAETTDHDAGLGQNKDMLALGGNIELTGFSDIDRGSMAVVKKIVGNYARRFSDAYTEFSSLSVKMKRIHEREKSEKYEFHSALTLGGRSFYADIVDRNLFFALDRVLKKLENESSAQK